MQALDTDVHDNFTLKYILSFSLFFVTNLAFDKEEFVQLCNGVTRSALHHTIFVSSLVKYTLDCHRKTFTDY